MKQLLYKWNILLLITLLVLIFDELFLNLELYKHLMFHIWASPLSMTISYIAVVFIVELLSILLLLSHRYIASVLLILYTIIWLLDINYSLIGGDGFTFNEWKNIIDNSEFIVDGLTMYFSIKGFIYSLIVSLFWYFLYRYLRKKISYRLSIQDTVMVICILLLIDFLVYHKIHKFKHYPTNLKVLHQIFVASYCRGNILDRVEPKHLKIDKSKSFPNIIFIVGESVRGDKLQINGFEKETTPYLVKHQSEIINLGLCVSSFTQSHESNMIMRTGIDMDIIPDISHLHNTYEPLVFYAKKAGYYTMLLDAQSNGITNGLRDVDKQWIDKIVGVDKLNCTIPYRDLTLIKEIVKVLNRKQKTFIHFNKYGSHFNYDDTYPREFEFFKPTNLTRSSKNSNFKDKRLNSYYNSLRWGVDYFFKELIERIKDKDVIVIYISDHGQSLLEDINYKRTHAGDKVEQSIVPLFIYVTPKAKDRLFSLYGKDFLKNKNKLSQFEIFPTILKLLGVETTKLSLFDKIPKRDRYYFSPEGSIGELIFVKKHLFKYNI